MDSSKLKELADDNLKFGENGIELSKLVENTVGKGEIASYEQFLLFPQCFQRTCTADTQKLGLVWERVKSPLMTVIVQSAILYGDRVYHDQLLRKSSINLNLHCSGYTKRSYQKRQTIYINH